MGLFNFFKPKKSNSKKNEVIAPKSTNEDGEFVINFSDFIEKNHKSTVLDSPVLSSDFEKEFAHLIVGKPMKKGDIIKINYHSILIILWNQLVEVIFQTDEQINTNIEFVNEINQHLNWLTKSKKYIDNAIIDKLFDIKNNNWVEKKQLSFEPEVFLKSIFLTTISFDQNAHLK